MKKKPALDRLREISKQRPNRGANPAAHSGNRTHDTNQTSTFAVDES